MPEEWMSVRPSPPPDGSMNASRKYSTERKRKIGMHITVALGKLNIYANKTMIYFTRTNKVQVSIGRWWGKLICEHKRELLTKIW